MSGQVTFGLPGLVRIRIVCSLSLLEAAISPTREAVRSRAASRPVGGLRTGGWFRMSMGPNRGADVDEGAGIAAQCLDLPSTPVRSGQTAKADAVSGSGVSLHAGPDELCPWSASRRSAALCKNPGAISANYAVAGGDLLGCPDKGPAISFAPSGPRTKLAGRNRSG